MREFTTAARRGKSGFPNAVDVPFKLDDVEMTAHPPTTGQVALYFQGGSAGGLRSIEALFDFFGAVLGDKDWAVVEDKLHEGIDIEVLTEISNYLIGEWSGRPIMPSSGSSRTPNGTGRKSTAKRRAAGRTTSVSR